MRKNIFTFVSLSLVLTTTSLSAQQICSISKKNSLKISNVSPDILKFEYCKDGVCKPLGSPTGLFRISDIKNKQAASATEFETIKQNKFFRTAALTVGRVCEIVFLWYWVSRAKLHPDFENVLIFGLASLGAPFVDSLLAGMIQSGVVYAQMQVRSLDTALSTVNGSDQEFTQKAFDSFLDGLKWALDEISTKSICEEYLVKEY